MYGQGNAEAILLCPQPSIRIRKTKTAGGSVAGAGLAMAERRGRAMAAGRRRREIAPGAVPGIVTGRLVLRGWRMGHFRDFAALWADRAVTDQVGIGARDEAASRAAFLAISRHWRLQGFGQLAVTDRATGAFLGQTGMFRAMRGYGAAFDDRPEAGWVLGRHAQGRGIGREAVAAAHRWFDGAFGGATVAVIDPANGASLRLAAGFGYRVFETAEDRVLLRREGGA